MLLRRIVVSSLAEGLSLLLAFSPIVSSQTGLALTDDDVVAMVRAGKSVGEITDAIYVCEAYFNLTRQTSMYSRMLVFPKKLYEPWPQDKIGMEGSAQQGAFVQFNLNRLHHRLAPARNPLPSSNQLRSRLPPWSSKRHCRQ